MATKLNVQKERIALVSDRNLDFAADDALLSDLGISTLTKLYVIAKFLAPMELFDGLPHPFHLNDHKIGGDLHPYSSPCTLITFLESLKIPKEKYDEFQQKDATYTNPLDQLEKAARITLPSPVYALLTNKPLQDICFEKLIYQPMVPNVVTQENIFVNLLEVTPERNAVLFLQDHQGCCYWYAVWDKQAEQTGRLQDCEVYTLFGGQNFEENRTVYLTSRHFWQFLVDYAMLQ
eukprot:Phypoly_transcript_17215.p1 GENE.Phypoly_transcript_17215~~Phypoly_transcript_17215.p1  ORF type:complete len:250 (+),score=27.32 Phypoly_transcript_17215:51-752(+)